MQEILVKSTAPSGARITIRHYSPELAVIDMIDRLNAKHTEIVNSIASPGEAVYAELGTLTATKERKLTRKAVTR